MNPVERLADLFPTTVAELVELQCEPYSADGVDAWAAPTDPEETP